MSLANLAAYQKEFCSGGIGGELDQKYYIGCQALKVKTTVRKMAAFL